MALVVNDRVKETSTTTGTGTISLGGAVQGFETFVAGIGNSNTTYYSIVNANGEFEVGLGTVTDATPDTLARTTVISSSNSDSAVNFSAGSKDVFCTLPASKAVIKDASGNIVANNGSNLTALNASNLASGTVPDARFPATLPAANGSALTALNASNLASGTVANARLDAQLQDVAGLATTSGKIIQGDGSNFTLSAYTLPTSDGSSSQVLTTDGSGAVTFQTPTVGDITSVVAGSGLTGGATSGAATLNVGAGTGVTVNADDIAIGQSVATSASPTFAGLTTTADINFGDNDKAIFGAGSDLQIFHDGSNSYISDTATGDLRIRGSSAIKFEDNNGSETFAIFNDNGAVELYHDNSKKFETASGGVTVTGEVAATSLDISGDIDVDGTTNLDVVDIDGAVDMASTLQVDGAITSSAGATITTADNAAQLTLVSTDADASSGPRLSLSRDSSSPANNDFLGNIQFIMKNDAGESLSAVALDTRIIDVADGSEDAQIQFYVRTAGAVVDRFNILNTEVVVNDGSIDSDFRVESNNQANAFKIDAGNDTASFAVPITTTENINFGDSDKAIFGDGGDLEIYHEGSHSFIDDTGTGRLYLRGNDGVYIQRYTGEDMIKAIADGAVELYHNNAKKLETTSGGVDVTGAITATGDVTAFSTSDKSLKKNVVNIDSALDKVSKINGVYYDWTEEALEKNKHLKAEKEVGVIAQDVEKVLPEIVATRDDGTKAVKYERLCALLIESVKELKQEIELLKNPGA